ncbi:MAG: GNAT family protein [Acidimicrobiia bacterium]
MITEPGPQPDDTNQTILHTSRLELSFGTDSDAEALFPFVHGKEGRAVTDYLLWDGPQTVEDIADFFKKHTTGTFVPDGFHWQLRDRTGEIAGELGSPLGSIGISQRGPAGRCDVGYWLAPPYWRQGLMKEALAAVVDHAFTNLGVVKLEADVFVRNAAGIALLKSAGFTREGTVRRVHPKRGVWVDAHLYGMIPEDLQNAVNEAGQ